MGQIASELLAGAVAAAPDAPAPDFAWTSGRLGPARIDLEDKEAVRRVLDAPS